jgi:hypothetical protein
VEDRAAVTTQVVAEVPMLEVVVVLVEAVTEMWLTAQAIES